MPTAWDVARVHHAQVHVRGFITIFCDKDEMLLLPDQDDPVVSLSNVIAPLLQISYSLCPII